MEFLPPIPHQTQHFVPSDKDYVDVGLAKNARRNCQRKEIEKDQIAREKQEKW